MQREASIWRGATSASVGQASMQRVQLPQRSTAGASDTPGISATASEVTMTPSSSQEPICWLITQVFFPIQPMPARAANARSRIGPVST